MTGGSGKLHGMTKPDGNHVWNDSKTRVWQDVLSPR